MSTELKKVLYHQICDDFEKSCRDIDENLPRYLELLSKIHETGDWSETLSVRGEDVKDPSHDSVELLEKAGILEGRIRFTERNMYKIFTLTEEGRNLIDKIGAEKK